MGDYNMDCVVRVWDEHGDRVDVCEDADALGLIEIRNVASDGKVSQRVSFPREAVPHVIKALCLHVETMETLEKEEEPGG